MKKSILFVSLLALMLCRISAQITINKSHISAAGKMTVQAYDTNRYALPGNGANYTWDFSNLTEVEKDTNHYGLPQWYPGASNFPTANMLTFYNSKDSSYQYFSLTDTELTYQGSLDMVDGISSVNALKLKYITFPSTFNTSFTDASTNKGQASELGIDPDGNGPLPFIDSIYFDILLNNKSIIDGYGTIKTPLGTFSTIRQKMTTISDLGNLKMFTNGVWTTVPKIYLALLGFGNTADTSHNILFWTNDNKIGQPLLTYSYSNGDAYSNDFSYVSAQSQTSKLLEIDHTNVTIFPNPCQNVFSIQLSNPATVQLKIYDNTGKLINTLSVRNNQQIDITSLEKGIYILQFMDLKSGANFASQKITKY